MPLHSRWPLFEVSESTWLPSASSASAKYSPSSTQKSRLKRRLRSAACRSSSSANAGSFQMLAGQAGAAHLRVVGVALELAGRAREAGQPPVAVGDRVPGVLPALVLEAGLLVAALVRDVAVALQVGVLVDPVQRRPRLALELAHELRVAGPALVLVEQHDVERRGVGAAVVRRVRPLLERGHLAVAHLVQDPARILVAEVVDAGALPVAERAQRRRGELGRERQRLQAREDAVAAEHRHEPRQAGGRQACARRRRAARSAARRGRRGCAGRSPSASPSRTRAGARPRASAPGLRSMFGRARLWPRAYFGRTYAPLAPAAGDHVEVGRPLAVRARCERRRSGRARRSAPARWPRSRSRAGTSRARSRARSRLFSTRAE